MKNKLHARNAFCQCGKMLTHDEAAFWGECEKCREQLPIKTSRYGKGALEADKHDREYHGATVHRGEW